VIFLSLYTRDTPLDSPFSSRPTIDMKRSLSLVIAFALSPVSLFTQAKPVIIVQPFTTATGVELPYDIKQMQGQLVAEFKVTLGKEFDIVAEPPAASSGSLYTLNAEIMDWRAGNAAKRIVIGLGSGREATDIRYWINDASNKTVLEKKDTVRTNFYSQGAGSIGTLTHPIGLKIAERIKDAKLK
jgi:hypothetical protein